jgi:hypothetical protein
MATRICLLPPDIALALPPARVRLLRRICDGLRGFDESDPLAVARAISFRELPERTTELFHSVVYFATDAGRAAIEDATRGRRDLAPWLLLTAIDLAIDVARAAEGGDEVARAVQARARAGTKPFAAPRIEYELIAKRCDRPSPDAILAGGRAVYGPQLVDAWVVECEGGSLRAVVVFGGGALATRAPSTPPPSRARPEPGRASGRVRELPGREPRPRGRLGCDTVRWDGARARVGLTLAHASRLKEWRVQLGLACAGDEAFLQPLASVK